MYYITQETFEKAKVNAPVGSLLTPEEWYVPLYVKGELMQTVLLIGTRFAEKEKWSAGVRSAKGLVLAWEKI